MKQLFVNHTYEQDGVFFGVAALDSTVEKNIPIVFSAEMAKAIHQLNNNPPPDGFHTFDKFCQFVVYVTYTPELGMSIQFMDFKGDDDTALDRYLSLQMAGWEKSDIDDVMRLYTEIKQGNKEQADLIDEPIPLF